MYPKDLQKTKTTSEICGASRSHAPMEPPVPEVPIEAQKPDEATEASTFTRGSS